MKITLLNRCCAVGYHPAHRLVTELRALDKHVQFDIQHTTGNIEHPLVVQYELNHAIVTNIGYIIAEIEQGDTKIYQSTQWRDALEYLKHMEVK